MLALEGVERVHVELGDPDEEPWTCEDRLVLLVVTDHVAGVLAQEALDALAELLAPLHVDLLHAVVTGLEPGRRCERRHLARLLVVEGHVGDEVADDRERAQRRDGDRLVVVEGVHAGHAHQPRATVDLGAARPALAGLAVPAHGEVLRLRRLEAVDDVEDDLALVHLDLEVVQLAVVVRPSPDPELRGVPHHAPPSGSAVSSSVGHVLVQLVAVEELEQLGGHRRQRLLVDRHLVAVGAADQVDLSPLRDS